MNRSYRLWYLLAALVALAPAGIRILAWQMARPQPVDVAMARAGEELFKHDWKPRDPLTPGGDGLGPVFNATSCVACHNQGGPGGGGGLQHNVTMFMVQPQQPGAPIREGVVHARATAFRETLQNVHPDLPAISQPSLESLVPAALRGGGGGTPLRLPPGVLLSQRNTPALYGAGLIDTIPERDIVAGAKAQQLRWGLAPTDTKEMPVGRALRLPNGRVARFGWKAQMASLGDFVQAACANELGLGNPGQPQPRPLSKPDYQPPGLDLTAEQCDQITAFVASLSRPVERLPGEQPARDEAVAGKQLFGAIGCADCHTPNLGSVEGLYSDLLVHRMGPELVGGGYYGEPVVPLPGSTPGEGPAPDEWRTPPLWGVADSAPYLHDGRAATLEAAIRLHGGQGQRAATRFAALSAAQQAQVIAFLKTLRAP